jgi:Flp pilus assembly secretin CpaC
MTGRLSRSIVPALGLVLSLAALGTLAGWAAQSPGGKPAEGNTKRVVYVVKHGSARDIAAALSKHFAGEAEAIAEPGSGVVLLSARPAVFDEVMTTLAQLDRPPRSIAVEITVIDMPPRKGANEDDVDDKEFSGAAETVAKNIKALQKKGLLGNVLHYKVTALENQSTSLLQSESKPMVTGLISGGFGGKGKTASSITYKNVGTSLEVKPRLGADKTVLLELRMEGSHLTQPEDGVLLGVDDRGLPIFATETVLANYSGKLSVPPGQAVLAQGVETTSKSGKARTLIIVSAHVVP